MRSWVEQAKLRSACDRIVRSLSPEHYRFRRISPVIFICGGLNSAPRNTLREYLKRRKLRSSDFLCRAGLGTDFYESRPWGFENGVRFSGPV